MLRSLLLFLLTLPALAAAPVPAALEAALAALRPEGAAGWGFVQTTADADHSRTERYDPSRPPGEQWTLLTVDGRAPDDEERNDYRRTRALRSSGNNAPNVRDQLDRDTCEVIADDATLTRYRFRLRATEDDDTTAAHMHATFALHKATGAITELELASFEPFSPVFGVKIAEARTVVRYLAPTAERPPVLAGVEMRVRGRAYLFKSLDSDLTITFTEQHHTGEYTPPIAAQPPAPAAAPAR